MCFQISAMNQNNGTIEFHYYECACQMKHILQKSRNPTIYSIIGLFAGLLGQMTHRPSV